MPTVNAGVIGLGRVGLMHVQNLLTLPEIEVVHVADLFLENATAELDRLKIAKRSTDYRDLLADPEVDTVFIFTSTDTHEELVTAAAKAGKNIFCEKPLSMSHDETRSLEVLRAVKEAGVLLQVGFNRRVDPQFRTIFESVRAGEIGDPQVVKITSRDPDLLPHALIQRIGGLLFDFTMHDFDMARYMVGSNITKVYATGKRLIDPTLAEIDDYDTIALTLEFESGAVALIDNSRRAVYGYDQRVEVFGSAGMLKAENISGSRVTRFTADHSELKNPLPSFVQRFKDAYLTEMRYFARSILDGEPLVATGEDTVLAQRAAVAAQRSIDTGVPVDVDPTPPAV